MSQDGRRHYSDRYMRRVAGLLRDGYGAERLASTLGISVHTTRKCVHRLSIDGEDGLMCRREGNKTYDYETKLAAVRAHVDEGAGAPEMARRYGIPDVELLGKWCRVYRQAGPGALIPNTKGRPKGARNKPKPAPTREQELERENRRLRAKVAYLEKYHALLAEESMDGAARR